jgi:hypothetical protein
MIAIMALEHLNRLMIECKGMPFANSLVQPLRDWFVGVHLETHGALQPQKALWKLVQRQSRRGYSIFLKRAEAATAIPCDGGFALFSLNERSMQEAKIRAEWATVACNSRFCEYKARTPPPPPPLPPPLPPPPVESLR